MKDYSFEYAIVDVQVIKCGKKLPVDVIMQQLFSPNLASAESDIFLNKFFADCSPGIFKYNIFFL